MDRRPPGAGVMEQDLAVETLASGSEGTARAGRRASRPEPKLAPLAVRLALALACLSAAALSLAHYQDDLRLRRAGEEFVERYRLDDRRPLEAATRRLEPAGDLALAAAVSAMLPAQIEPRHMEAGEEPPAATPASLAEARSLLLAAVRSRPGGGYHRLLLGRAEYLLDRAGGDASAPERWALALSRAADAAPGLDSLWTTLATAYLQSWDRLSPRRRSEASSVFARALQDPAFVSRDFLATASRVGIDRALALLPARRAPLEAAFEQLSRIGDLQAAARLIDPLHEAERRERAADLARIEERFRLGDVDGLRLACRDWVQRHPVEEFDDPAGRQQAARILELWPSYRPGSWSGDPRGELVRFFLAGREKDAESESLLRAVQALSAVPAPVTARVRLLAGDAHGAEALARRAGDAGSFEWTPYLVARARFELSRGRVPEARQAVRRIASAAAQQCDVLLVRRDVAAALGDAAGRDVAEQGLAQLVHRPVESQSTRRAGATVPLCLDPKRVAGSRLAVELEPKRPAIVSYGWNGGQIGTVMVETPKRLLIQAPEGEGIWIFSVLARAGPTPHFRAAFVETPK
ncbi:MAG: hypothetical protein ABR576_09105 [Thermoanaerobaculia bacterium]